MLGIVFVVLLVLTASAASADPLAPLQMLDRWNVETVNLADGPSVASTGGMRAQHLFGNWFMMEATEDARAAASSPSARLAAEATHLASHNRVVRFERDGKHDVRAQKTWNDPLYPLQWNLATLPLPNVTAGVTTNSDKVWDRGFFGAGVLAQVVDTGVDWQHPDLPRFWMNNSYNYVNNTMDPRPDTSDPNGSHGTNCAGVIAAAGDNGLCGVGHAPQATICGIRLEVPLAYSQDATAFTTRSPDMWVSTNSYALNFYTPFRRGSISSAVTAAHEYAYSSLRGGKGSVLFFASGNSRQDGQLTSQGSSIGTGIAAQLVAGIGADGFSAEYSNVGSDIFVGGPTHSFSFPAITAPNALTGGCNLKFDGTSAACPGVAGVATLMFSAFKDMTAFELYDCMSRSARPVGLGLSDIEYGPWITNGAGRRWSPAQGFGLVDADGGVNCALNLMSGALPRLTASSKFSSNQTASGTATSAGATSSVTFTVDAPPSSIVGAVSVTPQISDPQWWNFVELRLRSPMGTEVQLQPPALRGMQAKIVNAWFSVFNPLMLYSPSANSTMNPVNFTVIYSDKYLVECVNLTALSRVYPEYYDVSLEDAIAFVYFFQLDASCLPTDSSGNPSFPQLLNMILDDVTARGAVAVVFRGCYTPVPLRSKVPYYFTELFYTNSSLNFGLSNRSDARNATLVPVLNDIDLTPTVVGTRAAAFWGEDPRGSWTVTARVPAESPFASVQLSSVQLVVEYGSAALASGASEVASIIQSLF